MKIIFSILSSFLISNLGFVQTFEEIKLRMETESEQQKIKSCLNISEQQLPRDTIIYYLDLGLDIASKIHFDSVYPLQFAKSVQYFYGGDFVQAKKEILNGRISESYTEFPNATKAHINMLVGVFSESQNQLDSAKIYYSKATEILAGDTTAEAIRIISSTYTNIANLYLKEGNYDEAIKTYLSSLKNSENVGDLNNQMVTLNNIASCYKETKDYEEALFYYKKGLVISESEKHLENQGGILNGIGQIHILKGEYKKAIPQLKKAEIILKKTDFKRVLNITFQNLGECYMNLNDYKNAAIYSDMAILGTNEVQDDFTKTSAYVLDANIKLHQNKLKQALNSLELAHDLANTNGYLHLQMKCIKQKIKIYEILGNEKKQNILYKSLMPIKDSILNTEKVKAINASHIEYKTLEKERDLLQKDLELSEKEKENQKSNRQINMLITAIVILIFSILIIAYFIREKNRKKGLKEKQISENLNLELLHRTLDPHYINGVLNSIGSQILIDSPQSYQYLVKFSRQIQSTFKNNSPTTSLKTQIEEIEDYLEIQKYRFEDKLNYSIENTINISDIQIPKLIIQNMVENAIKYGLIKSEVPVAIKIKIRDNKDNLIVEVDDTGVGIQKYDDSSTKKGISIYQDLFNLFNTSNKLKASITLIDKKDISPKAHGVLSRVIIPKSYSFKLS